MIAPSDLLAMDGAAWALRMRSEADAMEQIAQIAQQLPPDSVQAALTDLLALTIARNVPPGEWPRAQEDVRRQLHYALMAIGARSTL